MTEYRDKSSGELKTKAELIKDNANMSFPAAWNDNVLEALNIDPVLESAQPETSAYQKVQRNGAKQDSSGNWVQVWEVVDMFADTTDDDGKVTKKAEHEAAYQATLDASTATANRTKRNERLAETDFYALSDVVMLSDMTTYRQALRDLPTHKNWPNLSDSDWPTKP